MPELPPGHWIIYVGKNFSRTLEVRIEATVLRALQQTEPEAWKALLKMVDRRLRSLENSTD